MMKNNGFTLIELLIAVAVVGILAAIAYPSYTEYTNKTRRAEVAALLMEAVQITERQYSQNEKYEDAKDKIPQQSPRDGGAKLYDIKLVTDAKDELVEGGYVIKATAVEKGSMAKDVCKDMSIDGQGKRLPDDEKCWRR
ncbi:type IV pilin protein [Metapseudomonas otitidis]|uniref:type IV pilin protein n=1 Tax=Metapseudomonas otitidis TaxID=319939 RepID=UPI001980425E|nr:type IV pilin protein [Pseudomonas otitidis]